MIDLITFLTLDAQFELMQTNHWIERNIDSGLCFMFVCIDGFSSSRETPNYHMTGTTFVCPAYAQSFAHTVSVSDTSCKKQLFVPLQPYTHATHTHTHTHG